MVFMVTVNGQVHGTLRGELQRLQAKLPGIVDGFECPGLQSAPLLDVPCGPEHVLFGLVAIQIELEDRN